MFNSSLAALRRSAVLHRAVLGARPNHNQVARFIGPAIGPIPVMKVPIRRQTAVGLRIEIPAAFHDAARFREELRDAPQLSGIICDDRHLAQLPERPILITGLTAAIAPQLHGEQIARSQASALSQPPHQSSTYRRALRTHYAAAREFESLRAGSGRDLSWRGAGPEQPRSGGDRERAGRPDQPRTPLVIRHRALRPIRGRDPPCHPRPSRCSGCMGAHMPITSVGIPIRRSGRSRSGTPVALCDDRWSGPSREIRC
jgi:hypothetical protein